MNIKLVIDKLQGDDTKGTIGKMNKEVGDKITAGELLFTIESGKGVMKYKSKYNGIITSLDIDEGDTVMKKQIVGVVQGDDKQHCADDKAKIKAKKQNYTFGINTPAKEEIHCDVLIIGGGPGGYVAAIRAAQLGQKTILIEKDKLGGTCLNYGCIPTKALVHSTEVLKNIQEADEFGFNVSEVAIDFEKVMERKDNVVNQLVSGISGLMKNHNIRVIYGEAVVGDEKTITIKNKKLDGTITFKKMIIATGAVPFRLPIPGGDMCDVLTSKEMLELDRIPSSIVIIGGGVIGMEIGFIYSALGSVVSIVEYLPRILSTLDNDVSDIVRQSAIEAGIHIYDNSKVMGIRKTMNNKMVTELEVDDESYLISSDKVLMAVGRKANIDALDYERLGVKLNERGNGLEVNEFMCTSNEDIYAIGDITNIIQLAHVASHQGMVAAEHIAGIENPMHYDLIPSAIFTSPEIGTIGINENQATELKLDVKIVKFPLMACGKAIAMNQPIGFVKLIVDESEKILLGGTIVGAHGTDLIATITQLIHDKETITEALKVVYAHPTLGESVHEALLMADDRGIHFG